MNGTQQLITIVYAILVLVSLVGFVALLRTTRRREGGVDTERLAHREIRFGAAFVALIVVLLGVTIVQIPYGRADAKPGAQVVRVTAAQFAFAAQPASIRAGRPTEFRIVSRDVQHGFGVYDGHELLFQVQVPAKGEPEQRYTHTFSKPGRYEIICLEFCGFQHHLMRGVLNVQ